MTIEPTPPLSEFEQLKAQLEDLSARHLAQTVKLREAQILFETEQGKLNKLLEQLAALDAKYIAQEKHEQSAS